MPAPLLIFDGDCGFCRIWVEYWKRLTGDRVVYEPYQKVAGQFPEIPRDRFAAAVHLALPDGQVLSGAHAVFQALAFAPGRGWLLRMYKVVPGFAPASEGVYALIAGHRPLFFAITKFLFGPVIEPARYEAVRWLFLKMIGAIYCIAFLSLAFQITGLIGSAGILPLRTYLTGISEALGSSGYWNFPTVFWLGSSDLALKLVCAGGVAAAILAVVGVLQRVVLMVCWALYLSLVVAGQDFLSFQWDILLLEAGFLAILLSFSPWIVWMLRWLLFRLMLLSGAVKLLSHDPAWRTLAALRFHYQTQPLPTPIAWYMQQLPGRFQDASVLVMFAIELGTPFLIFAPRRVRFFAGMSIVFLQVMILLTGNYTYFNLLTIALCVPLLDDAACSTGIRARVGLFQHPVPACSTLARYVLAVVSAFLILLSGSQLIETFFGVMPDSARAAQLWLSPLNLTNTYGLFAVMTTVRREIIVEGSRDGASWQAYEFKYKPGDVRQAPRWVAPHQPRLDWQMWFAALGSYRNNPWFVNFVFRLLEGSPEVTALLARNPFPGTPPRYVRALVYDYSFTGWQTRRATGAWWKREPSGTYLPAVSRQDFRSGSE